MVPSVTMNGVMRSRATSAPVAAPTSAGSNTPKATASAGPVWARSSAAMTTVVIATAEPTDRSIPPSKMT
jgi:hypothetical protein